MEAKLFGCWSAQDLEELDMKFDALCEYLGVEFVFEKISDGSENADEERCYCRKKKKTKALQDKK